MGLYHYLHEREWSFILRDRDTDSVANAVTTTVQDAKHTFIPKGKQEPYHLWFGKNFVSSCVANYISVDYTEREVCFTDMKGSGSATRMLKKLIRDKRMHIMDTENNLHSEPKRFWLYIRENTVVVILLVIIQY